MEEKNKNKTQKPGTDYNNGIAHGNIFHLIKSNPICAEQTVMSDRITDRKKRVHTHSAP